MYHTSKRERRLERRVQHLESILEAIKVILIPYVPDLPSEAEYDILLSRIKDAFTNLTHEIGILEEHKKALIVLDSLPPVQEHQVDLPEAHPDPAFHSVVLEPPQDSTPKCNCPPAYLCDKCRRSKLGLG